TGSEVARQTQRHFRRDRAPSPHDLVNSRCGDPECLRDLVGTELERLHEVAQQDVPRVYRAGFSRHDSDALLTAAQGTNVPSLVKGDGAQALCRPRLTLIRGVSVYRQYLNAQRY